MSTEGQDTGSGFRKHLYLVTSHPDEDRVGLVESREKRYEMAEKNEERRVDKRNLDTGEGFTMKVVGLGFHVFQSDTPSGERFSEVAKDKLAEIDDEHLESAGFDPEDY